MVRFKCKFHELNEPIKCIFADTAAFQLKFGVSFYINKETEIYDGPVMVTPSISPQYLYTKDKKVLDNITINPIPRNYGLITYNGFELTVS